MTKWNTLIESHTTEFDKLDTLDKRLAFGTVTSMLDNLLEKNLTVLDFGCGAGRFEKTLTDAREGLRVFGYDPAPVAIALAKKGQYQIDCTFENKLIDRQYDVALVNFVLCTMPDISATVKTISKVLKPGGKIIISEPHPDGMGYHFCSYHPEKPQSFVDGAEYTTHLSGMEPFIDYWHPKSAYRNALHIANFEGIVFTEVLAFSNSVEWRDERIQAPYLHICAEKVQK